VTRIYVQYECGCKEWGIHPQFLPMTCPTHDRNPEFRGCEFNHDSPLVPPPVRKRSENEGAA